MTQAVAGFGGQLQIGDGGSPENFTTIAEVKDVQLPQLAAETVDVTSHDSPGGWEEVIVTILRSGQVTFQLNWIPSHATHNASTGLWADLKNKTKRNFKWVAPDASSTTLSFSAYVIGFNPADPVSGALTADITLKPTGEPTLA